MILLFVVLLISPAPNTVTNAENGLKKNYVTADVVDEETKDAEERSELPTESDKQEVVTENGEEEVIEEFDESNTDSALEESEFVDESEDQGKHKKEEQDKRGESLLEKAVDGMKEFAGSVLSKFQLTSSEPQYVMATDADFSGTSNGNFRYTGSAEYVEIPHKIKGVSVTSYRSMFQSTSVKGVKSTNENITDMSYMFAWNTATSLDLSNLNTSKVTNMESMFYDSKANSIDLSNFDTSKVTNMKNMFAGSKATSLDLSNFNTSNVTDMSYMFYNTEATTLDISSFDTSNVIDMRYMFNVSNATTLDLSNFNTSNVINMKGMFDNSKATSLDLSNFNTSQVTDMSNMFTLSNATTLNIANFDTSNVTNMKNMFSNSKVTSLDLSHFNTSNVVDMSQMFLNSRATVIDLSGFDTSNVTDMTNMFQASSATKGYARTQEDANRFKVSSGKPARLVFRVKSEDGYVLAIDEDFEFKDDYNGYPVGIETGYYLYIGDEEYVEIPNKINGHELTSYYKMFDYAIVKGVKSTNENITNMRYMFLRSKASELDLSKLNTSNVTDMYGMFQQNEATQLNVSGFDTSNVTTMRFMFFQSKARELDLSNFNTSNVTDMFGMFENSKATKLNVSSFDTRNVTDMGRMFDRVQATQLNISNFDTSNVTNMSLMFNLSEATSLDLSNFNTSNVTNMSSMFLNSKARELNLSSFDTRKVTDMSNMFYFSQATELDLSSFEISSDTNIANMFRSSRATIGFAKTREYADRLNNSTGKPEKLNFVVKGLPNISFEKNGDDNFQKTHRTKVGVEIPKADIESLEYIWTTSETPPENGWMPFEINDEIIHSSGSGDYYLHVRATSSIGKTSIETSNVFKFDNTKPTLNLSHEPTEYTSGDVTITVTASDVHSGIKRIKLPDNQWINDSSTTYLVKENATYTFEVEDNAGNVTTKSIEVLNIDKLPPTIELSKNGGDWAKSHTTVINVTDDESGVDHVEYVWSTSTEEPTGSFTEINNNGSVKSPDTTGNYYLHVRARDNVGNMRKFTSKAFKVDVTAPTAPKIDAPESWKNTDVTVKITDGQDEHSGVNRTEYRINDGPWTVYKDEFAISTEGETMIEAKSFDHVSNESSTTSLKILIDKVNPTLTITQSPTEPTHDEVVLKVNAADDRSGVKQITLPDGTTVTEKETTYIAKQSGTYKFIVEDNAGNKHTEIIEVTNIDKSSTIEIPGSLDFGNVKLIDKPQVITADIPPIIVKDWRDAPNEWSLHVSASPVKLENENFFLPVGTIQLDAIDQVMRIKGSGDMPTKRLITKTALDDGEVTVVQSMNSRGEYKLEFPSQALEITIDPTTTKAGKYESTMTWKLVTAP